MSADPGDTRGDLRYSSAILNTHLGPVDIIALSGYSINRLSDSFDATPTYGTCCTEKLFGVPGTLLTEDNRTTKFSQELRFSSRVGTSIDWLAGFFFTHENSPYADQYIAANPQTGVSVASAGNFDWTSSYTEYAGFVDITWHVTDRFNIQVGGRESQNKQSYSETDSGSFASLFYGGASMVVFPEVATKDNSFTYLVTPQFKLSPDLMVYARLASGYRPGGPNSEATVFGLPATYSPDKTQNYEIGVKGDAWTQKLTFDASLYRINWKNIQLTLVDPNNGLGYFANGSQAKSQGIELSVQAKPGAGLTLGSWVEWNDATLTKDFPIGTSAYGNADDRLPYSSRFSGNVSFQEDLSLTAKMAGFIGGSLSYVGSREGVFASIFSGSSERQIFSSPTRRQIYTRE